jgi:NhaP-type Na+/H+ or K+/H+ antiporter
LERICAYDLFFMDAYTVLWENRHAFATLSFMAETFLFLYVGMDALDIEKWKIVGETYRYASCVCVCCVVLCVCV